VSRQERSLLRRVLRRIRLLRRRWLGSPEWGLRKPEEGFC
jgi:hypothetical protein